MMGVKFLLLAFLALQASDALSPEHPHKLLLSPSIEDSFEEIIEQLKQAIQAVIDKIAAIPQQIVDLIKETVNKVIGEATEKIQQIIDGIKAEIEALMQEAVEHGQEAVNCVVTAQQQLEDHITGVFTGNEECIATTTSEGEALITDASALVSGVEVRVQKLMEEWALCSELSCYIEVIGHARDEVTSIVAEGEEIVGRVDHFVTVAIPELPKCVANNIQFHAKALAQVVVDTKDCIGAVINP